MLRYTEEKLIWAFLTSKSIFFRYDTLSIFPKYVGSVCIDPIHGSLIPVEVFDIVLVLGQKLYIRREKNKIQDI